MLAAAVLAAAVSEALTDEDVLDAVAVVDAVVVDAVAVAGVAVTVAGTAGAAVTGTFTGVCGTITGTGCSDAAWLPCDSRQPTATRLESVPTTNSTMAVWSEGGREPNSGPISACKPWLRRSLPSLAAA